MSHSPKPEDTSAQNVAIFGDLFKFIRESTGLAMSIAYLTMILSSTAFLYIKFSAFNINILQFITLEDILITPIKNTDIILVFLSIICLYYINDLFMKYSHRKKLEYRDKETPWYLRIFHMAMWTPKKRENAVWFMIIAGVMSLASYIFMVATFEVRDVKDGDGEHVRITLADKPSKEYVLLGSSSYFVFAYDAKQDKSFIFNLEAVETIEQLQLDDTTKPQAKTKTAH